MPTTSDPVQEILGRVLFSGLRPRTLTPLLESASVLPAPSDAVTFPADAGTTITSVNTPTLAPPPGADLALGVYGLTLQGSAPGFRTTVTVTLPRVSSHALAQLLADAWEGKRKAAI